MQIVPDVVPVRWDVQFRNTGMTVHADVVQGIGASEPGGENATGFQLVNERSDVEVCAHSRAEDSFRGHHEQHGTFFRMTNTATTYIHQHQKPGVEIQSSNPCLCVR